MCVLVSWVFLKVRAVCRSCRQRPREGSYVREVQNPKQLPRVKVLPVVHAEELSRRPPIRLPEKCVVPSARTAVGGRGRVIWEFTTVPGSYRRSRSCPPCNARHWLEVHPSDYQKLPVAAQWESYSWFNAARSPRNFLVNQMTSSSYPCASHAS